MTASPESAHNFLAGPNEGECHFPAIAHVIRTKPWLHLLSTMISDLVAVRTERKIVLKSARCIRIANISALGARRPPLFHSQEILAWLADETKRCLKQLDLNVLSLCIAISRRHASSGLLSAQSIPSVSIIHTQDLLCAILIVVLIFIATNRSQYARAILYS